MLGCWFRGGGLGFHFRAVFFSIPGPIGFWGAKPRRGKKIRRLAISRNYRALGGKLPPPKKMRLARRNVFTFNLDRGNACGSGKTRNGRKKEKEVDMAESL
jgi:hypothetical protein